MKNFNDHITGELPVLVEFFASWCPHCQRMMPRIENLKQRMAGRLKVVQLDIDSPANREAILHFGIDSYPTFILFKSGRQLWRGSGERTVEELVRLVEEHL